LLYRKTFDEGPQGAHVASCSSGCGSVVCQAGECSSIQLSQRPKFEN
jgi:hypothetical protein